MATLERLYTWRNSGVRKSPIVKQVPSSRITLLFNPLAKAAYRAAVARCGVPVECEPIIGSLEVSWRNFLPTPSRKLGRSNLKI